MEQSHADFIKEFVSSDNFEVFKLIFKDRTGKKLETLEQVVDAISSGLITPRDLFEESMNALKWVRTKEDGSSCYELEDYWLDNIDLFDYDTFFPPVEKQVNNGGAWVKIKTENGYQIHLARKATRKHNFNEEVMSSFKSILRGVKKSDSSEKGKAALKLKEEASIRRQVFRLIGRQPYELWYWRTKTQKAYVSPSEYEMIDINEYIDYVQDKTLNGVLTVRSLFTSNNKEKVFYLKSRGISEDVAKIFANLHQCYFDMNITKGLEIYNKSISKRIKLVEKLIPTLPLNS